MIRSLISSIIWSAYHWLQYSKVLSEIREGLRLLGLTILGIALIIFGAIFLLTLGVFDALVTMLNEIVGGKENVNSE